MTKFFKILTTTIAALAAVLALALFAACGNGESEKSDPATTYYFTVVGSDDQPINGQTGGRDGGKVAIQICTEMCVDLNPLGVTLGTDGKVSLTQEQVNTFFASETDVTEFAFHALHVPGYVDDCEVDVKGPGEYTLKLSVPAAHVCESECPFCGKCTDETCTEAVCADKCEGHVYNLTITLPDGNAAANATISIGGFEYAADAQGKYSLDLVAQKGYIGVHESYELVVTSGEYSKTVTIQAVAENYDLTIALEA